MQYTIESDLFKAAGHKYVKRTGTPGNYKYWYKLPDGRLVSSDDEASSPHKHHEAQREHIRRLIIGRLKGHHAMTNEQIATEVGVGKHKVNENITNLRSAGKRKLGGAPAPEGDHAHHGHDFEEHHLHEAKHSDVAHPDYERHISSGSSAAPARSEAAAPAPSRSRRRRTSGAEASRRDTEREIASGRAEHDDTPSEGRHSAPRPAAPAGPSAEALAAARARVGVRPAEEVRQVAAEARANVAARAAEAMRSSSPTSPEARELASSDPSFAASEAPIREMVEAQRRGENPYLKRAKDIFHNIQHDIKEERRNNAKHMLSALEAVGAGGTEAQLLAKYKELSGRNVRTLPREDFEKATFMTLDEVMHNDPINVELERMKRGYAAKQFARIKPFLKESFTSANPSAPPPYPKFGDIKTWTEHGSKPSWAGTTRTAVPRDIFDAAVKGADGKPKYPPEWMPLHLMPVWNYVAKKTMAEGGNPYQTTAVGTNQQGRIGKEHTGSQAQYQEGMMKSALRKYVVMRGGAENLVDIPASKLAEAGLTHGDIFKGPKSLDHILTHKIIDPVGLLKIVKQEMKGEVKKSWALCVPVDNGPVRFKKSYVIPTRSFQKSESKADYLRRLIDEKSRG